MMKPKKAAATVAANQKSRKGDGVAAPRRRRSSSDLSAAALLSDSTETPVTIAAPARVTKRDQLTALLLRDEGATLDQMIAATSWLPHTVRASLSGLRKAGYGIDSDKVDGVRTYRAVAPK